MKRANYLITRALFMVLSFFAVVTLLFLLFRIIPGDVSTTIFSPGLDEAARQRLAAKYGLNEPLHIQYIKYVTSLLQGDLGTSFHYNEPVTHLLIERTANTAVLILGAMLVAFTIGPAMGAYFAWHRNSRLEKYGVFAVLLMYAAPVFWTAMLGLMVFSYTLGWVPSGGMSSVGGDIPQTLSERFLTADFLKHLALPFLITALYYMAIPTLLMRNTMIDVLGDDFIQLKRAEGLPSLRILYYHAARNSLLPVMHYAAVAIGFALGGSVVIEVVFSWPGLGRLLWTAVSSRDYPLAQGGFLMIATITIIANFWIDMLSLYIDPRTADPSQQ